MGIVGALALWLVARRFHVNEDPRIDRIEAMLPGANCGACGCSGCRDFAATCVSRGNLEGLNCPGAGAVVMARIAAELGVDAQAAAAVVAAVKCNGSCTARPRVFTYDGVRSCAVLNAVGVGTAGCSYGCLGCGDCVAECPFDALHIDAATGLPVVDMDKCTGCGRCVKACPRAIIELRPRRRRNLDVLVACSNHDRGAIARRDCAAACIACGKCQRACPFEAITLTDNLAYIDASRCRLCRKCVDGCPTGAILTFNFPVANPDPTPESQQ